LWKKIRSKIESLSAGYVLCQKFAVSVKKLQLPVTPTFLIHDAAESKVNEAKTTVKQLNLLYCSIFSSRCAIKQNFSASV